ncbi:sugar phosphate nucleotidyltransferase [Celerinatantimonas diazotrophica]|uniref:Nucleotidyltransferase-like protein n=1 Tax=Celerinatantimonas diazotrophica TaxID=412034 RepID=A0A4R1K546_9GAMM|nr:sugar phosphate nucleotidyltransferase [Celerinatantimonas diazotrophica]TCK59070.1 nucleotidyltransferase-like protein [Celerinatantimonas diazotrophica]CAG9297707.1 hypothetical protein CEDIAZO_02896 [Celerinatantimonas diazotrophica]
MTFSVIMSGKNGSRLWPLSQNAFPKQFRSLNYFQITWQDMVLVALDSQGNRMNILDFKGLS